MGFFLDYDNLKMKHVRDAVKLRISLGSIHPALVLNFDQVWRMRFRPKEHRLFKDGDDAGKERDPLGGRGCSTHVVFRICLNSVKNPQKPTYVREFYVGF